MIAALVSNFEPLSINWGVARPRTSTYHGVLAHQDNTLATEGMANLVHLLGADIVDFDDESRLVVLQQALELIEVAGLVASLTPHIFLFYEGRMFKGK